MRIVLAPDSFKGSLSAAAVADAMAVGFGRGLPGAELVQVPLADGGEGTLDALVAATGGVVFRSRVSGPLGDPVRARWGVLGDGRTAVVELAEAAGLGRVPERLRDPSRATTTGVGELIAEAMAAPGIERLVIGLGGSATNDAGAGILRALGWGLLDDRGEPVGPGGLGLESLARVVPPTHSELRSPVSVTVAVDVSNPLLGPDGASAVFGPQKGADPEMVGRLDRALARFRDVSGVAEFPGAGAAGGAAFGLAMAFPDAVLRPGIDLVLDAVDFADRIRGADLVVTGEGRMDRQTLSGKVVAGVARRCREARIPVAVLCGDLDSSVDGADWRELGVFAAASVVPGPCSVADAMGNASDWIASGSERMSAWLSLGAVLGPR
jgi:glycerate kinase